MTENNVARRWLQRAAKRLPFRRPARGRMAALAAVAGRLTSALRPAPTPASFLWPAGCLRHREALAPLIAAGDSGLLNVETVAGKRILCLVEADADITIVRQLLWRAGQIDFVLQAEHEALQEVYNHKFAGRGECSLRMFDNVLSIADSTEVEYSERNFQFFQSLTRYFESVFDSEERLAKYRPFSSALAAFVGPITYASCFATPIVLDTLVSAGRPDLVIIICRGCRFFAPFIAALGAAEGKPPVLIGCSDPSPANRLLLARRIAEIVDLEWLWLRGPRRRGIAVDLPDRPGEGIAVALEQLEATTAAALVRFWPELAGRHHYGAVTTLQSPYVTYNYRFRQQLLERLAETFDLNLFLLDAEAATQQTLLRELQNASRDHRQNARFVPYASSDRGIHDALVIFLDRHRAVWQSPLVQLAGGDWVLPVFETVVFDWMVDLIAAGLEYITFLQSLFRSCPPAFALAITGQTATAEILLTAARQASVPTFDMQIVAIYDHPHTRITLLPKADHFFALDLQSAELLARWGWPADRLYINGAARFDQLQKLDHDAHRAHGRELFAARQFKHLIVFISQVYSLEPCRSALQATASAIAGRTDTLLVVKLHPREPSSNRQVYEEVLANCGLADNGRVIADIDIDDALCASDLVVGLYSSALLEAACLRKPVIAANLTGTRFLEPINFADRDCILGATSASEIETLVQSILDDPGFRASVLARQSAYFQEHSYAVDGGAMERVATTINEIVEGRTPGTKSLANWRHAPGRRPTPDSTPVA